MMKPEDDPITDDEWLLRRVRQELFPTPQYPVFSNEAFKPRYKGYDPDTDGISFFREACVDAPQDVLADVPAEKRAYNGIVRVSVAFLKSLGLTIQNKPEPPIKGHVVIPQLNAGDYKADKARFHADPALALAKEASKDENIVRHPGARPLKRPRLTMFVNSSTDKSASRNGE